MKKKTNSSAKLRLIFILVCTPLLLLGIWIAGSALIDSTYAVYEEHDNHLTDLSYTVDHNVNTFFESCRFELSTAVSGEQVLSAEKRLLSYNDNQGLTSALSRTHILKNKYAKRIILKKGSEIILSSDQADGLDYYLYSDYANDDVYLCKDESTDTNYIALSVPSKIGGMYYSVLIDTSEFYRSVVVNSIFNDYWIILYDEGNDLLLQNNDNVPSLEIMSKNDIRSRNDGYTILLDSEEKGARATRTYSFSDGRKSTGQNHSRISVIPSSLSENRIFAIGVAIDDETITVPMQRRSVYILIAAFVIAFSSAAILFIMMHTGKRETELANELQALEQEKKLADDLLKKQEELAHHQKLEAIGTLTAGVAHEFNNLLSPIMGNSMLILENTDPDNSEIYDNSLEIYEASRKAKALVSKISKLSRKNSEAQMHSIMVTKLIKDVLLIVAPAVKGNITVKTNLSTNSVIFGDEAQLSHALINLIINAIQAMAPDGGTLTVACSADDSNVFISVSDTGPGIPKENMPSLFQPFFTTKEAGKGTGLGLAIAQQTAVDHNGIITAENLHRGGARFTLQIPLLH